MKKVNFVKNQQVGLKQDDEVMLDNAINRAGQELTLAEKRLMILAFVLCNSSKDKDKTVEIRAVDYAKIFQLPLSQAYEQMKDVSKSLLSRQITLRNCDLDGEFWHEIRFVWVQSCKYHHTEGKVRLMFSELLHRGVTSLKSRFTKYKLEQVATLKSTYAWRLLELFEQMLPQDTTSGWLEISIEDFWLAMDATDTYRKDFSLLNQRILKPALKELTEKGQWSIQWEALKTGRKVTRLNFKFTKPGRKLAIGEQEFETPRETVLEAACSILGGNRAQMEQERKEKVNQLKLRKMLNSLGEWTKFSQ